MRQFKAPYRPKTKALHLAVALVLGVAATWFVTAVADADSSRPTAAEMDQNR